MTHTDPVVNDVIDRVVRNARLPGGAARDELRRELESHFHEAGAEPEQLQDAVARFGSVPEIADGFRHVYRWDFFASYFARVCLAFLAALVVYQSSMALVHLRVSAEDGLGLSSDYPRMFGLGFKIVLALTAAWEIRRKPFDMKRAGSAFVAYWVMVILIQAMVLDGLKGWEPWNIPCLLTIGVVASRVQRLPLRLIALICGYTTYLFITRNPGLTPRPLHAFALTLTWVATEAAFVRLDRWFAPRLDGKVEQLADY